MINLLSRDAQRQLQAARHNVVLRRYVTLLSITAIAVGGIFGTGYYLLMNNQQQSEAIMAQAAADKGAYSQTITLSSQFSSDLAVAKKILGNDIALSNVIMTLARTLPPKTIFTTLSVATSTLSQPASFTLKTTSYDGAISAKNVLDASPYFEDVSIASITYAAPVDGEFSAKYPYTVNLSLKFTPTTLTKLSAGEGLK